MKDVVPCARSCLILPWPLLYVLSYQFANATPGLQVATLQRREDLLNEAKSNLSARVSSGMAKGLIIGFIGGLGLGGYIFFSGL